MGPHKAFSPGCTVYIGLYPHTMDQGGSWIYYTDTCFQGPGQFYPGQIARPVARDIHPMLAQGWASVADAGPTFNQHLFSVSCLQIWHRRFIQPIDTRIWGRLSLWYCPEYCIETLTNILIYFSLVSPKMTGIYLCATKMTGIYLCSRVVHSEAVDWCIIFTWKNSTRRWLRTISTPRSEKWP